MERVLFLAHVLALSHIHRHYNLRGCVSPDVFIHPVAGYIDSSQLCSTYCTTVRSPKAYAPPPTAVPLSSQQLKARVPSPRAERRRIPYTCIARIDSNQSCSFTLDSQNATNLQASLGLRFRWLVAATKLYLSPTRRIFKNINMFQPELSARINVFRVANAATREGAAGRPKTNTQTYKIRVLIP